MYHKIVMVTLCHGFSSNHKCFCVLCLNFLLPIILFSLVICKRNLILIFCIIGITTTCSMFYLFNKMVYGLYGDVFCDGYDVF